MPSSPRLSHMLFLAAACLPAACMTPEVRDYDRRPVWSDDDSVVAFAREWVDFEYSETNERHKLLLWDPTTGEERLLDDDLVWEEAPTSLYAMANAGYLLATYSWPSGDFITRVDLADGSRRDAELPQQLSYWLEVAVPSPDGERVAVLRTLWADGSRHVLFLDDQLRMQGVPVALATTDPVLRWDIVWTPEGLLVAYNDEQAIVITEDGLYGDFTDPFCREPRTSSSDVSEDRVQVSTGGRGLELLPTDLPVFGDDCAAL